MVRCRPSRFPAIAIAILLVAVGRESSAQSSLGTSGEKITVREERTANEGVSDLQADCEIYGGILYIDRGFAGAVPYVGTASPGKHYIELKLPGYDNLGIWLDLQEKTKYFVSFNPTEEFALFAPNDRISVSKVPSLNEAGADIDFYCEVNGGMLYIDKVYVGNPGTPIPYSCSLPPGSHYIEIELGGYRDLGTWIVLEAKTYYTIRFNPKRATGYLSVDIAPSDALLSVDGAPLKSGVSEQPVGKRRILARRFGYVDRSLEVDVRDGSTSPVSVVLEKAPFEVKNLGFSRKAFNPRNAGPAGRTSLDFTATSYGSARAEISGPDGSVVATLEFPSIEAWSQTRAWDGLGPDGKPLPDGVYTAALVATPKEGGECVTAEAKALIDSTILISAFGSASGIPGLLYMPDPVPESAGMKVAETFYFLPLGASGSSADPAFGLSGAMSIEGIVTLALQASAETAAGPIGSGDLSASVLVALFGDKASAWSGAGFVRGGYSSTASPSMPGARSAVEAALPLGARLGELWGADLRIALAPGARADFSAAPAFFGLMRGGLWLEGRSFRAGLSGELPIGFAGGPAPEWPVKAALEGRLMLGSSPFVAAGYATAGLSPSAAPAFGIGLGIGLLF
jgi:hypothetical protein